MLRSTSATTSATGKRHRSRKDRILVVKTSGTVVSIQKEIDEFTEEEISALGLKDLAESLHWVCRGCRKSKGHASGCEIEHAKTRVKSAGTQTNLLGYFGSSGAKEGAATSSVLSIEKEEDVENPKMLTTTSLPKEAPSLNEDSISNRLSKYASDYFHSSVKTKLYNSSGRVEKAVMVNNNVMGWSFPLPSPLGFNDVLRFKLASGEKVEYTLRNEALAFDGMSLVVVDYENFFTQDAEGLSLACPCGKKLIRNGWTSYCRIGRGFNLDRVFQAVDYLCENCLKPQPGKRTSSFNTLSNEIIAQLPSALRSKLDFVVDGSGYIVNRQILPSLQVMISSGMSFAQIEKVSRSAIETEFARRELSRLKMVRAQMLNGSVSPQVIKDKESLTSWAGPFVLTASIACSAYIEESRRTEAYRQSSFARAAIGENVLQNDGCFPYGNDCSDTGVVMLQNVLNMSGEVVAGFGTCSRSSDEFIGPYRKIAEYKALHNDPKSIKAVWTDNPKSDEAAVKKAFGEVVQVRKDIFHVASKVNKAARLGHPLRPTFAAQVSNCFFEHVKEDLDREAARLKSEGKTEEEVKKLLQSPFYVKNAKSIRTTIRDGKDIAESLRIVISNFVGTGLLVANAIGILDEVYGTLSTFVGEVLDEEAVLWDNVGTEAEPKYLVRRGTNMCENFHRFVKQLKLYRFSSEVGNHIYIFSMWLFSLHSRCHRLHQDLLEHVYDPILMNDLVDAQVQFKGCLSYPRFLTGHAVLEPMDKAEYFSGLVLRNPATPIAKAVFKFAERCEEFEIEEPEPYQPKHRFPDILLRPEHHARPFNTEKNDPEFQLLRRYITKDERFFNAKAKKLVRQSSWSALYSELAAGKVREYILIDNIAEFWMNQIIEATWDEKDITEDELVVSRACLKPKSPQHIADGLRSLGSIVSVGLSRSNDPHLIPRLSVSTKAIPSSSSQLVVPVPAVSTVGPHLPAPSVTIPAVSARKLNEQSESADKRMKVATNSSSISVAAPSSDAKQPEGNERAKRQRIECPECGAKKHDRSSKCGFVEYVRKQKALPVDDPERAVRHTDEQPYDCFRRGYIEWKAAVASKNKS